MLKENLVERTILTMENPRAKEILEYLGKKSPLTIEELSNLLPVSAVTIRRDLIDLEKDGLIIRQRGGASLRGLGIEPLFNQRQKQNIELKKQIAKFAAEQISEGEVIALDVGTTTAELAKELIKKNNLTIFTNSFQVASILSRSQHNVYLVGGFIRKSEMSMVGSIARETIMKFNFDRFYLGLAGISKEEGPTDYNLEDAEIKRCFIERSKEVVALVDKTKFTTSSLVRVCKMDEIDKIITNKDDHLLIEDMLDFKGQIFLT
jgi:DeoR/GlpR family transcriptional regulator of sugar metabolism